MIYFSIKKDTVPHDVIPYLSNLLILAELLINNLGVELLKRLDGQFMVLLSRTDTLDRCLGSSHGGHIGHLILNGSLPDVAVIGCTLLIVGGVDNQSDGLVGDDVQNVGTALCNFCNLGNRDTGCLDELLLKAMCAPVKKM